MTSMQRTAATLAVARELLKTPTGTHGYGIAQATGHRPGSVTPILARMFEQGWLTDAWEDPAAAAQENRGSRRVFTVTPLGFDELRKLLGEDEGLVKLIEQTRAQLERLLLLQADQQAARRTEAQS